MITDYYRRIVVKQWSGWRELRHTPSPGTILKLLLVISTIYKLLFPRHRTHLLVSGTRSGTILLPFLFFVTGLFPFNLSLVSKQGTEPNTQKGKSTPKSSFSKTLSLLNLLSLTDFPFWGRLEFQQTTDNNPPNEILSSPPLPPSYNNHSPLW